MDYDLRERGARAKTWTVILWGLMLLGPIVFFLSLLSVGVWLLGMSLDWWRASENPPSDDVIFGPVIAIAVAEILGGIIAYVKRDELAGAPFEWHATSIARTFWTMLTGLAVTIGLALALLIVPNIDAAGFGVGALFVALFTLPPLFIWKACRAVRGLRRAMDENRIAADPTRRP